MEYEAILMKKEKSDCMSPEEEREKNATGAI